MSNDFGPDFGTITQVGATRLINDARLSLPGALDNVIQQVFFQVVDEFFRFTNVWQNQIPFLTIDPNTQLLLHMDGTQGSTTFTDSANGLTVTANGHAVVSGVQAKFGGQSAAFDGTAGTALTVSNSSSVFTPTTPFTLDFWVYLNTPLVAQSLVMVQDGSVQPSWALSVLSNGHIAMSVSSNGAALDIANAVDAGTLLTGVWNHVAFVWTGTTYLCFVNGAVGATVLSSTAPFFTTGSMFIGANKNLATPMNGFTDELRFSSVARWTAAFVPPFFAYSPVQQNDAAGTPSYTLVPFDSPSVINRLMGVVNSSGTPQYGSMPVPGTLLLTLAPSQEDSFIATVALTCVDPTDGTNWPQFPSWIMTKYRADFLDGVLGKLMSQPSKPYSNERMSVYYLRRWENAKALAKAEVQRANTFRAQAWFFPRGWGTRRQKFTGSATSFY